MLKHTIDRLGGGTPGQDEGSNSDRPRRVVSEDDIPVRLSDSVTYCPTPYIITDDKLCILHANFAAKMALRSDLDTPDAKQRRQTFTKYITSGASAFISWLNTDCSTGKEITIFRSQAGKYIAFKNLQFVRDRKFYHISLVPNTDFLSQNIDSNIYQAVFQYSRLAIYITDAQQHITMVNPGFTELSGYSEAELIGHNDKILYEHAENKNSDLQTSIELGLREQNFWSGQVVALTRSGNRFAGKLTVVDSVQGGEDGQQKILVHILEDIEHQLKKEEDLKRFAETDELTQLYNRAGFTRYFSAAFEEAMRSGNALTLMYLDLDNFKYLNDNHGHELGDELLINAGKRLNSCVKRDDFVARLGGDEFVIVIQDDLSDRAMAVIAEKVIEALGSPYQLSSLEYSCSASIGIARYPRDAVSQDALLRAADAAMYMAKRSGRNDYEFFDAARHGESSSLAALESGPARAAGDDNLKAFFQPVHSLVSGKVVRLEALARMVINQREVHLPSHFLDDFRQSQRLNHMGQKIVSEAFGLSEALPGDTLLPASINLSIEQLQSEAIFQQFAQFRSLHPAAGASIEIELDEQLLLAHPEALRSAERLAGLGLPLILDNASLATATTSQDKLTALRFAAVKISLQALQSELDGGLSTLAENIAALQSRWHCDIIAKNLEDSADAQRLIDAKCQYGQGYLYSPAMPLDKVLLYVNGFA